MNNHSRGNSISDVPERSLYILTTVKEKLLCLKK